MMMRMNIVLAMTKRGVGQRPHKAPSVGWDKRPLDFVAPPFHRQLYPTLCLHSVQNIFFPCCCVTFCIISCRHITSYFEFVATWQHLKVCHCGQTTLWRIHRNFSDLINVGPESKLQFFFKISRAHWKGQFRWETAAYILCLPTLQIQLSSQFTIIFIIMTLLQYIGR